LKVFGAGILSSTGEIPFALFSHDVTRRPFVTDEVIETGYYPSRMHDPSAWRSAWWAAAERQAAGRPGAGPHAIIRDRPCPPGRVHAASRSTHP
jgi:hypothetical protein